MERSRLVIGVGDEVPVAIQALLDMLAHAREETLRAVEGLSVAQLDHHHDEQSNSIGSLLLHIASVEAWYQTNTFDGRDWNESEAATWEATVDLGDAARVQRGHPLEHYLNVLAEVRARTAQELARRDEEWLLRVEPFGDTEANNYWKWFHVCEDEINHRGQIRWLRKRLPAS